jgi:hypothetical protein
MIDFVHIVMVEGLFTCHAKAHNARVTGIQQNTPKSGSFSLSDNPVKTGKARKTARFCSCG